MREVRYIGRGQELRSTVIHRIRFAERVSLKRGRTHGVATCTSAAALVKLPIVMGDFAGLGRKQKKMGVAVGREACWDGSMMSLRRQLALRMQCGGFVVDLMVGVVLL